jgi:AcrR family transcriptional regulator
MAGRPKFAPTDYQRGQINAMVVCGIPEDEIARALGVGKATLLKYYGDEIAVARTKAHVEMGSFLYATALAKGEAANRLVGENARIAAAIFYAKTQMRWRETSIHLHGEAPPDTDAALEALTRGFDRLAAGKGKSREVAAAAGGGQESPAVGVAAVGPAGTTTAAG